MAVTINEDIKHQTIRLKSTSVIMTTRKVNFNQIEILSATNYHSTIENTLGMWGPPDISCMIH